ncbi:MAG TPA: FecR family protein [Bdellovibrionota bacterium]|jgi:hypothetical protein|nr:FecR family protein [Bdellovibrionota bacterium]
MHHIHRAGLLASVLASLLPTHAAFAVGSEDQVGTLTRVEGQVRLLSDPSTSVQGAGPHARFEGQYYTVVNAHVGDRFKNGNVITTSMAARARLVYDNGDLYTVGPATEFKIKWTEASAAASSPSVDIRYGTLRGVVSKGGPRTHLTIRTKTATMGVRGTEFFVADQGATHQTSLAVLRGAVQMKSDGAAKPVEVKSGQTASFHPAVETPAAAAASQAPPKIEVATTTKEELGTIRSLTTVKAAIADAVVADDKKAETVAKAEALEHKAVETALADLKTHAPELAAQVEKSAPADPGELEDSTVDHLIEKAPPAPPERKPFGLQLDDSSDVYKKYFK